MKRFGALLAIAMGCIAAAPASAASYPDKPIRFIVSFPPGSGADTSARFYARELESRVGQTVVVENKPGGNSFIAAQTVTRAPADGYTLFFSSNSPVTTNVATFNELPYDPVKELTPVARLSMGVMAVAVPGDAPYQSFAEFVETLRRNPGKFNYGSGSASYQIATELFLHRAGAKATHIPYKGAAPALVDLAGKQLDFVFADLGAVIPHLQSGALRMLAQTGDQRLKAYPDTPTLAETFDDYYMVNWTGVFAPAGTPEPVVTRLEQELLAIEATPQAKEMQDRLSSMGFPADRKQFARFQREEIQRWDSARETAGIPKQ
ncbi:tripartite tricarboxylate transporter substrate binding protein [Verticiella sediminum]|uniref:Tripartite tricarboxylate transporter substrate binding protein n=1 Tax=Verticiella sediminum TaxID=1247510 RepID=A0A556B0D1_9BURK|nr:tripartite tricarboxylate transporter substrate binding protein [Verticiella sediminum]TSH98613.1 tripartite tricarboxylate transporter substrate binding protein [Verticiella sediminum]